MTPLKRTVTGRESTVHLLERFQHVPGTGNTLPVKHYGPPAANTEHAQKEAGRRSHDSTVAVEESTY